MRFIIMIKSQCVTCVILVAFNFMQVVFKYIYIYSKKNVAQVNSINQWDEILSLGCKNLFWPFNYTWSLIPHDLSWSFLYFLICLEDENCLISTNEIWEFKKKKQVSSDPVLAYRINLSFIGFGFFSISILTPDFNDHFTYCLFLSVKVPLPKRLEKRMQI